MATLLGVVRRPTNAADQTPPVPYAGQGRSTMLSLFSATDPTGAYEQEMTAYGQNGTLFSIVDRLASSVSGVNWRLYESLDPANPAPTDDESRREVTSHLALQVLNNPNPWMTRQELFERWQQHQELTGEGIWIINREGTPWPRSLWPVRPDKLQVVTSPTKFIAGYVYVGPDGEKVPLEPADVIVAMRPNPLDPYRGLGPVQSMLMELDSSKYSAAWNRNFFVNSAEPGGIITVQRNLSDDAWRQMVNRWDEQHKGLARAHRVAILENATWESNSYTQKDMQFVQLRTDSRDQLYEAFGIPKSTMGVTENVNKAVAAAGEITYARWLLVPRLERDKGALNHEFLPQFGDPRRLFFDYDNPIPKDTDQQNAEMTAQAAFVPALVDAGFDPAGVLAAAGLPAITYVGKPATTVPTQPTPTPGEGAL